MAASVLDSYTTEYDQNAALAELDRVLRSSNLAERCDGILKVPLNFEKYPFPMFITSALLKLMEAFRNGTTLTRKWILHVAECSEKHLDKIISPDELMKRVLTVTHSNDPNARALTMKLFAWFARVLADRKHLHHLFITSLDSNDLGELQAAIFAAQHFAKYSPEFGRSVFDKVMQMLMSIDVPPETKLLLAPIFEHFYSDVETSQKAIIFCRDQFLPQCHSSTITGCVLTALTKLAVQAVIIALAQLELLLAHVTSKKASKKVIISALDCLHFLARETPHIWSPEAVLILSNFCDGLDTTGGPVLLRALKVVATLTRSPVIRLWSSDHVDRLMNLCGKQCYSESYSIASASCVIASNMVNNLGESPARDGLLVTLTLAATTAIATWPWRSEDKQRLKASKIILRCALQLAKLDTLTAKTMAQCLYGSVNKCSDSTRDVVTECILAICDADLDAGRMLESSACTTTSSSDLLDLCLTLAPKSSVSSLSKTSVTTEQLMGTCTSNWQLFLLGRRALRYGYATASKVIFNTIKETTTDQSMSNWIRSLVFIATAEECLASDEKMIPDRLALAITNHHLALIHMRAAVTPARSLWFSIAFIQLRQKFLSAVQDLHTLWYVAVLIPPSASCDASTLDNSVSRVITELKNCERSFGEVQLGYETLLRRCFDSDDGSIELLKLLKTQSLLLQQGIRSVTGEESRFCDVMESSFNAQTTILSKYVSRMAAQMAKLRHGSSGSTREGLERLLSMVQYLCSEVPFFVPRFFFQCLQSTNVRLSFSPKPTERDNSIRHPSDQRFLLNVEGVISVTGPKAKMLRKAESVIIVVSVQYSSTSSVGTKPPSGTHDSSKQLEKAVSLHNDYFSADFLLDFPMSGTVNVSLNLIDERGMVWDGNAEEQLKVKVLPVAGASQ